MDSLYFFLPILTLENKRFWENDAFIAPERACPCECGICKEIFFFGRGCGIITDDEGSKASMGYCIDCLPRICAMIAQTDIRT